MLCIICVNIEFCHSKLQLIGHNTLNHDILETYCDIITGQNPTL